MRAVAGKLARTGAAVATTASLVGLATGLAARPASDAQGAPLGCDVMHRQRSCGPENATSRTMARPRAAFPTVLAGVPGASVATLTAALPPLFGFRGVVAWFRATPVAFADDGADCAEPVCDDKKELFKSSFLAAAGKGRKDMGGKDKECPLSRSELGRSTWEFLHTTAAYYPEQPSPEQQVAARQLIESIGVLYACKHCREHFQHHVEANPPDVSSRTALALWLCQAHNLVNEVLDKPQFSCDAKAIDRRWRTGCRMLAPPAERGAGPATHDPSREGLPAAFPSELKKACLPARLSRPVPLGEAGDWEQVVKKENPLESMLVPRLAQGGVDDDYEMEKFLVEVGSPLTPSQSTHAEAAPLPPPQQQQLEIARAQPLKKVARYAGRSLGPVHGTPVVGPQRSGSLKTDTVRAGSTPISSFSQDPASSNQQHGKELSTDDLLAMFDTGQTKGTPGHEKSALDHKHEADEEVVFVIQSLGSLRLQGPHRTTRSVVITKTSEIATYKREFVETVVEEVEAVLANTKVPACHGKATLLRTKDRYFLTDERLQASAEARKSLSMGDLWFISKKHFKGAEKSVWVFRSMWHGANSNGVVQVEPVSSNFAPRAVSNKWSDRTRVFVARGPNVEHEIAMVGALERLAPGQPPVLEALVDGRSKLPSLAIRGSDGLVEDIVAQFSLNEDQQKVLRVVDGWICGEGTVDPVALVHGAFGSGKSKLAQALIIFLSRVAPPSQVRICVAGATNVAVDNILKGLLEDHEFDKFARVGSVRSVDRSIMPHLLHYHERGFAQAVKDAQHQLRQLGRDAPQEVLHALQNTSLKALEAKQRELEKSCQVIGVTCCSSVREQLVSLFNQPGQTTVCIVDEASQAVEPLSMLPIANSNASLVVLIGDPLQLPPVTVCRGDPLKASKGGYAHGGTPMFERLCAFKTPILLSTQYRCHPAISDLASQLFYGGRVRSGIKPEDRPALVSELGPLTFVDIFNGEEQQTRASSFVNPQEQRLAVFIIQQLLQLGIEAAQIGVITLYRAQAAAIQSALSQVEGNVAVSTVDAFQGA
ncbi:Protein ZGRF1 (GRF-type zinc finger domain-containing protein 1), partial [Durusdinium trenchii]